MVAVESDSTLDVSCGLGLPLWSLGGLLDIGVPPLDDASSYEGGGATLSSSCSSSESSGCDATGDIGVDGRTNCAVVGALSVKGSMLTCCTGLSGSIISNGPSYLSDSFAPAPLHEPPSLKPCGSIRTDWPT